ncbi:hypothetical protein EES47_24840 [Streptomyces sp. ADI98-12]|nr:hypothetical protein EES47_24840 [Streptomyces sp. ADI98-12]
MPVTRSPTAIPVASGPTAVTRPAASDPSSPASPGYMPSAFSTSRKFRPAARTSIRTSRPSGSSSASGAGTRERPSTLPGTVVSRRHGSPGTGSRLAPVASRASRATRTVSSRTANCVSPAASRAGSWARSSAEGAGAPASRSRRAKRPGFSASALRASPCAAAAARSLTPVSVPVATAPRVTNTRRPEVAAAGSSHSWISARVRAVDAWTAVGVSSSKPSSGTRTRSGAGVRAAASARPATGPGQARSVPRVTACTGAEPLSGAATHSTRRSPSCSLLCGVGARRAEGARRMRDSAESTGAPSTSTAEMDTVSSPTRATRTRTTEAPPACSDTPDQENGTSFLPSPRPANPTDWTAASSSAGCIP